MDPAVAANVGHKPVGIGRFQLCVLPVFQYLINKRIIGRREQLELIIEEKSEEYVRVCYEAYTAWEASGIMLSKLKEIGRFQLCVLPVFQYLINKRIIGRELLQDAGRRRIPCLRLLPSRNLHLPK